MTGKTYQKTKVSSEPLHCVELIYLRADKRRDQRKEHLERCQRYRREIFRKLKYLVRYNSWHDPVSVKLSKLLFQVYPSVQPHNGLVIRRHLLDHRPIACVLHLVIWAYSIQSSHLATLKYIIIIGKTSFGVKFAAHTEVNSQCKMKGRM